MLFPKTPTTRRGSIRSESNVNVSEKPDVQLQSHRWAHLLHWPTAGRMVPKTLTTARTVRPKNCSPSTWLHSLAVQAVEPFGSSVVSDGINQNLFETASASMPAKRASFTMSNCPYGVPNRPETLPIRNQPLMSPDPTSVATAI